MLILPLPNEILLDIHHRLRDIKSKRNFEKAMNWHIVDPLPLHKIINLKNVWGPFKYSKNFFYEFILWPSMKTCPKSTTRYKLQKSDYVVDIVTFNFLRNDYYLHFNRDLDWKSNGYIRKLTEDYIQDLELEFERI